MATDCDLSMLVDRLLADPVPMPGWDLIRWRRAVGQPLKPGSLPDAIHDPRLSDLLTWVGSHSSAHRRLGAVAAVMAKLDFAYRVGITDRETLIDEIEKTTRRARPLAIQSRRARPQTRTRAHASLDHRFAATDPSTTQVGGGESTEMSPLLDLAARLLHSAGCDLGRDERLAVRVAVALDVAVDHWMGGAEAGEGLPAFPAEGALRSDRRLTALLGGDRDLRFLVYGPQPGRGRPRQDACRRGLAYWVALALVASHRGEEPPAVPPEVLAHWRLQLSRIGSPARVAGGAGLDSLDVPSA